jgi:hypothetical protein
MKSARSAFFLRYWGVLLTCVLTIFAMLPLFHPGFFPIHDDEQVGRLYELDLAVKAGHLPPRIAPDLGFGYGYPLFNFYPSFVYYIGEIFVLLGSSYIVATKLMIALGFLAAAVCMYLFAREYLGESGGVAAAVAYTYAPYHSVDVYVRGALPEFWSFVFIPALFWSLKKLSDTGEKKYIAFLALFSAGLILTHNLVALMSVIFVGGYVLYLLFLNKQKRQFFLRTLYGGLAGLLLSSYFWLPSYVEKKFTMIELLTTELADYRQHFVYLRQLWNSPWGYGGSLYGLLDGLSFQIGKLHLIFSLIMILATVYFLVKRKKSAGITFLFAFFLAVSIFLMSFYSKFLWDAIQPLSYIQFPWRFLLFAAFTSAFLLGGVSSFFPTKKIQFIAAGILVVGVIALNLAYFQPEQYKSSVTDADYISQETLRWRTSAMAFEYVPKGIATKLSDVGTTIIDITPEQVAKSPYQVVKGDIQVTTLVNKPQEKSFAVTATQSGILRLNTFAFPGWRVYSDGKEITYTDTDPLKLMTVSVPSGEHKISATFTNTPVRTIGDLLSLVGAVMLLGLVSPAGILKRKK